MDYKEEMEEIKNVWIAMLFDELRSRVFEARKKPDFTVNTLLKILDEYQTELMNPEREGQ